MPSFPSLPKHLKMPSKATKLKVLLENQLNFYRLHLLFFTFVSVRVRVPRIRHLRRKTGWGFRVPAGKNVMTFC
jgi:hypothetical protein